MRERTLFNNDWLFFPEDIPIPQPQEKSPSYRQAKTERHLGGPASRFFPDAPVAYEINEGKQETSLRLWRDVTLPHDYIINQEFLENANNSWGFKNYHPAWYRKHFRITSEDRARRMVLYFEGIADRATVYFNGCEMYHSFESHTPFEVDLTDFIRFDEDNVLAIRVETGTGEGWWYQGGGIYRNVWLEKYDDVSVDRYGVYAAPKRISDAPIREDRKFSGLWQVPVEVTVRNDRFEDTAVDVTIHSEAFKADVSEKVLIPAREKATVTLLAEAEDPALWDIDEPNLYTLDTMLKVEGEIIDAMSINYGYRTISFNAETGFYLNGKNVKVKGVCTHGDNGLTGLAVPDSIYRYRASLIKEMGANAFRCSHYPHAEYWMDEMDRKGIIVMDEVRWFSSAPDGLHELEVLMKRDRNHPSVFLWSVGNEEPFFITEQGARIAHHMYAEAKKLDKERPIITANDRDPEVATVYQYSDIVGVNYHMTLFDKLHEIFPGMPILSTENTASGTTRDWYYDNVPALGRISGYDHDTSASFLGREKTWRFIYERPWLMGGMQWDAFEHRGEAAWPRVCSASGAIDLFLQRKDGFYQNQSFWSEKPMVHLLPHWNWPERLGQEIPVWAYSNCEEVELFLNGESLGRKALKPVEHAEWSVVYTPGKLEVVGYKAGQEVCRDVKETSGPAVSLKLVAENANDIEKGEVLLLTCKALDRDGREVPDAAPTVTFFANNAGRVFATGSDNTDHVPQNITTRKMYMGKISIACETGLSEEPLVVYATADGLRNAELMVEI